MNGIPVIHSGAKKRGMRRFRSLLNNNFEYYLMLLPVVVLLFIFSYIPIYGVVLAFKDFDVRLGIMGSPWAGFKHFEFLVNDIQFFKAFKNTVGISIGRIIFEFPIPIILALLLNEVVNTRFRKICQTIYTFPHFISWIVVAGLVSGLMSNSGAINQILEAIGIGKSELLTNPDTFQGLLYFTSNWKEAGWGTIIYLATITSINPELYEAAAIDGAKKRHNMRYITWPSLKPVICILLILKVGSMMSAGFDQIINMYNPSVMDVSDIIDTYVYRRTFQGGMNFSVSTAIGLFKSLINVVLLLAVNYGIRWSGEESLF